jgi:hypothetical protein
MLLKKILAQSFCHRVIVGGRLGRDICLKCLAGAGYYSLWTTGKKVSLQKME